MAKSKSTPTPTLAQLRKLAKRKGYVVIAGPEYRNIYLCQGDVFQVEIGPKNYPNTLLLAWGALRALPDKGGPRG